MTALPIDPLLPKIVESLRRHPTLVLEAPPGAGKTTRVPPALLAFPGEVVVLEPRRIAARMAARRVAEEMGEPLGETVGYQVRFEEAAGPRTRLRFVTEGVLTRRFLRDPELHGVGTVILDEFHERHLDGDLALALLLDLQRTRRPDLRIVAMSATLDAGPIAEHLMAPVLRSEGLLFPLEIRYQPSGLPDLPDSGHVLYFLPGRREIRDAMAQWEPILRARGRQGFPLYGELPPEEQDRALAPSARPKMIFATNVAESSITIDGVTVVLDSGLARVASDDPWTGLPKLEVARISQASAVQRAGRAARTGPGLCIRLYPAEDFARRAERDKPEIFRRELSGLLLQLRAMRREPESLPWLDAPPVPALAAARTLLDRLHADDRLTRYPLHPRLARLVEDAGADGAREAARLLDDDRVASLACHRGEIPLPRALLRAFPDRVARRTGDGQFALAGGGSAGGRDIHSDWIVALDLQNRFIRRWSAIEPDWLIDEFPERIAERDELVWNRDAKRVDAIKRLEYDGLAILEERAAPADASELLFEKALEAKLAVDDEFRARAEFAGVPLRDGEAEELLREACTGGRSLADLDGFSLAPLRPNLDRQAPRTLRLPSGRQAKVHYVPGRPPWVASRLQDFFGMRETPKVGGSPIVVHLLAPNQRPVQMTQDLAGFWERLYPQVRRELMRRYPKHKWPEDPLDPAP
ncbi:MAG: ATP-dependent helicase C-terminal domain-containing protein [Bryobacteraceae bacterium]|nr:ATP-dependent helicase C-terminal domain-containing protein [Bryobacteraceae bacterium]